METLHQLLFLALYYVVGDFGWFDLGVLIACLALSGVVLLWAPRVDRLKL